MHEMRPFPSLRMDVTRPSQRILFNRILLITAVLFAALGVAAIFAQPVPRLELSLSPAILLFASALWLLVCWVLGRFRQNTISGWLVVVWTVALLGLGFYLLPTAAVPLLPLALLPIALAALLLNRPSIIIVAVGMAALASVALLGLLPPAPSPLVLPVNEQQLALIVVVATSVLLSALMLPFRGAYTSLVNRLLEQQQQQAETAQQLQAVIQEREAVQAQLAAQSQHLDALAERIRDGVIALDDKGQMVRANSIAREIYAELPAPPRSLADLTQALATQEQLQAKADLVPLPTFGLPSDAAYSHVLIDRREEARLARLRGELLGLLTDEMRNPLTSMVTALDLSLGQNDLPNEVDRVLLGARQSGQRLLELVTMLLEISQFEQRARILRLAETQLSRVIERSIAQMSPLAQRGAVTVSVEHAGDSLVSIDAERVQRAFSYLLEQALRQSPPYSIVQVRTRQAENQVIVQISDQGAGQSVQNERVLRSNNDERNAPALGLIYSKLVIEAHGGRLWSEASGGQGSSYHFSLPLQAATA